MAKKRFFEAAEELDDSQEVTKKTDLWEKEKERKKGETRLVRTLLLKVAPRVKTTAKRRRAKRGIEMKRNVKETEALDLPNGRERSSDRGLRVSYHRFAISVSLMKASR